MPLENQRWVIDMDLASVRTIIASQLTVDVDLVRDEASFSSDLGATSLDMIELAMRLEEMLYIAIDDHEWELIETVGDAVLLIQSKSLAASPA